MGTIALYRTQPQALPAGAITPIDWQMAALDDGQEATYQQQDPHVWVVPTSGLWDVRARVSLDAVPAGHPVAWFLYRTRATTSQEDHAAGVGAGGYPLSGLLARRLVLHQGDLLSVRLWNAGAVPLATLAGPAFCRLEMFRVN